MIESNAEKEHELKIKYNLDTVYRQENKKSIRILKIRMQDGWLQWNSAGQGGR